MRPASTFVGAVVLALLSIGTRYSSCQATVGLQPHGSYMGDFDKINLATLATHIDIPLFVHKSRGANNGISVHLIYDPDYFTISTYNGDTGWRVVATSAGGGGSIAADYQTESCPPPATGTYQAWSYYFYDASGYRHKFPGTSTYIGGNCQTLSNTTLNASIDGYVLSGSGASAQVTDRSGTIYVYTAGSNWYVQDSNGNQGYVGALTDSSNVKVQVTGGFYQYPPNGGAATSRTPTIIQYTDANGNPQQITISYKLYNWANVDGYGMVDTVTFPDNSAYHFTYQLPSCATGQIQEGTWGHLASIELPTGGMITYQDTVNDCNGSTPGGTLVRTTSDGASTYTNTGSCTYLGCLWATTIRKPDGSSESVNSVPYSSGNLETAHYWYNASGGLMKSTMRCYNGASGDCTTTAVSFPLSQISTTTTLDNGQTSKSVEYLNGADLQTELDEYDYGASSPSRKTVTVYASLGNNIQDRPSSVTVYDGGGNIAQKTTYSYDQTSVTPTSSLPDHTSVSGSRGNLTTLQQQFNSSGSTISTTYTYDDAGQMLSRANPNGKTTYAYDATDTYVTNVTPPTPSSGVSLPTNSIYDPGTGLLTSSTDPNGTKTAYSYDAMLRPLEVDVYSSSGGMVRKTAYTYYSPQDTGVANYQNSSTYANTRTLLDGYGRLSRVAVANGQSTNPWYQQDTCYDADGNLAFQSSKYQGKGWATAKTCSGVGDSYANDALGRIKSITHADGTSIQYSYAGRATQMIDENGVSRITQADGLGRTTIVCEISSNSNMPGSGSPSSCGTDIAGTGFTTNYGYDLTNHKTTITQGAQQRVFQTDWLGRPVLTQEPERGQTTYSYAYNGTGLVVTRQRPQANQTNASVLTTTTTQYDAVGRLLNIQYSDGTPTRNFSYDSTTGWQNYNLGASKGRLTYAGISGAGTMYAYYATGLVSATVQCQPSGCGNDAKNKWSYYAYDWIGNVLSASNGDGVTTYYNNYSPANEVGSITSSLSDATHPGTLLSNVAYGANGPTSYQYGNGLTTVLAYDPLGRIAGGWVCKNSSSQYCTDGTQYRGFTTGWKGTRNLGGCDTILGCQTTGYDDFNRLNTWMTTSGPVLNLAWVYDRYGNRWQQNVTAGTGPSFSQSFNTATNQINSSGYRYDAAGNMTSDGIHTYSYDAEGNVIQVDNGTTANYVYDALNQRVHMDFSGQSQEFVFNLSGQRTAYWDAISGGQIQGQTYWGTQPIEYYEGGIAHFQHQDWLGTERMRTLYDGSTEGQFASLPFGDGYSFTGSNTDQYHFAALDFDYNSDTYHAQYRQYTPAQGRWQSPDPYDGSYDFSNPQSFNRYSYVLNNPLSNVDPTGLYCAWEDGTSDDDPTDGGATYRECTAQGGHWTDLNNPCQGADNCVATFDWNKQNNGSSQPIKSALQTIAYTLAWANGLGFAVPHIYYPSNSLATQDMRNAGTVKRGIQKYKNAGCPASGTLNSADGGGGGHIGPWQETRDDLLNATPNPTQAEVGGYTGSITNNGDGTVSMTIDNTTGLASLLGVSTYAPSATGAVDAVGTVLGAPPVEQTFQWTEPSPCGHP